MLRITVITTLCVALGIAAYIQIFRQILRSRAEQLLIELRNLESAKGGWNDIERFVEHWKAFEDDGKACNPKACDVYVSIDEPIGKYLGYHSVQYPALHFLDIAYLLINPRWVTVDASLAIRDSEITRGRYSLSIEVARGVSSDPDRADGFGLLGIAEFDAHGFGQAEYWSPQALHPDYWVGKPGGCEGCIKIVTEYSVATQQEKILELTRFNFACITRWTPCSSEGDIMPAAWKQYQEELPDQHARRNAFEHCQIPLDFLSRGSSEVSIADVVSRQFAAKPERGIRVQLRLLHSIKGQAPWPPYTAKSIAVFDWGEPIHGWSSDDIAVGKRYILLGGFEERKPDGWALGLESCGVIAYTSENLAEIQRGFDQSTAGKIGQKLRN